uniref:PiggyBac transposable element-derived protein domain-containing protein n=1 Tax=Cuerna arida TaxID=1464854 RepID=A0A1B6GS29_9HEMI
MERDRDCLLRSEDIRREMEGLISEEDDDIVYDSDADIFDNEENEANSFDLMDIEIDSNATNSELLNSDVSVIQTPEPDLPENVGLPHNAVSTENDPLCNICQWHHNSNFEPKKFEFDEANSGLHLEVDGKPLETLTESDIFYQLFDWDIISHIAAETNKYAKANLENNISSFSKLKRWVETNPDEIYCFLAVIMLMPHNNRNTLKQCWSTDPLLESKIYSTTFSQDRFLLLLRMIHFDDNSLATGRDKLYKIRTLIETLRRRYMTFFKPKQNLVIDESLVGWKGRLGWKQYIPKKRKRFGIKLFVLCDCSSGIVLDFIVYTGKGTSVDDTVAADLGISAQVIQSLMQPYIGLNHVIYLDNWYSSPQLYNWLFDNSTGSCGTVRSDRQGMPCFPKKMKKGEVLVCHTNKMLAEKWCDKRQVTMLSTIHKHEMVPTEKFGKVTNKPASVCDYNRNMGAVDKADMIMSFNDSSRKTTKWYRKLFFHLLDVTVLNAHYMHKIACVSNQKQSFSEFRLNLIRQILEAHSVPRTKKIQHPLVGDKNPTRLVERHFPTPLPFSGERKRKIQRQCFVCSNTKIRPKQRKDTSYECKDCKVALCIHPCFAEYHTKKKF